MKVMKVKSEFDIKHFVDFTKTRGGGLEILHCDSEFYTIEYCNDIYKLTPNALRKVELLNQNLIIEKRIVQ